jgi:hypothetical protein
MKTVAALYDIHGNFPARQAALAGLVWGSGFPGAGEFAAENILETPSRELATAIFEDQASVSGT